MLVFFVLSELRSVEDKAMFTISQTYFIYLN